MQIKKDEEPVSKQYTMTLNFFERTDMIDDELEQEPLAEPSS